MGISDPETLELRRHPGYCDYSQHFGVQVSIVESHHQQLPGRHEQWPPFFLSTVLAFPQSCAPHRAPRTGLIFQEASLQRSPSQKCGDCNLMIPETEAIGNSVSVPDFAREVILIPHNTSIPLCFLFYIFFLLIVGPCEACGYNKKTEAGMPLN